MPRRKIGSRLVRAALLGAGLSLWTALPAVAVQLVVRTISDPLSTADDFNPRIAGQIVVWQHGTGTASEIQLWNGSTLTNVTNNGVADENPETDGARVVWQQDEGGQFDIAVYTIATGMTTFPFTSPDNDTLPLVSGPYVAWLRAVGGGDDEVFLDPNSPAPDQITGNSVEDDSLSLDGGNLAWTEVDDNGTPANPLDDHTMILAWDGTSKGLYQLTNDSVNDIRPDISGTNIVWQSGLDGSGQIWQGDTSGNAQVLYSGTDDRSPRIDANTIVWQHWDGVHFQIFERDLTLPYVTQVTSLAADNVTPQVSVTGKGANLIWVQQPASGDSEIWVSYHGGLPGPILITRGDGRTDVNPRVDGDHFVWESCTNYNTPSELCQVRFAPEPRATFGVAAAIAALGFLASRSARRAVALARTSRPR